MVAANDLRRWEDALKIWHAMRITASHKAQIGDYSSIIKAMGKGREPGLALEAFDEMTAHVMSPSLGVLRPPWPQI